MNYRISATIQCTYYNIRHNGLVLKYTLRFANTFQKLHKTITTEYEIRVVFGR